MTIIIIREGIGGSQSISYRLSKFNGSYVSQIYTDTITLSRNNVTSNYSKIRNMDISIIYTIK